MASRLSALLLDLLGANPGSPDSDEGGLWYAEGKHRRKDADGIHDDTDIRVSDDDTSPSHIEDKLVGDGIAFTTLNPGANEQRQLSLDNASPGAHRFSISPSEMFTPGVAGKVEANDYAAIEFPQIQTDFASYSLFWKRTPSADVKVTVKFILKSAGTGDYVRIAARVKARATGEDSSTAFDATAYEAVTVTTTTIGEVFQSQLTFSSAIFAQGDAVAIHIGRDGGNTLGGGTDDDYSRRIQVIAIEVEVP